MDSYQTALNQFPASPTNNTREIIRRKLDKMRELPNDKTAQELDAFGFSVDHDDYRDRYGEWEQSDFSNDDL